MASAIDEVAKAHAADLAVQDNYEVKYLRYWVDEPDGTIFCLVEAPSADAASTVHREAHGLVADQRAPGEGGVVNARVLRGLVGLAAGALVVTGTGTLAAADGPSKLDRLRFATAPYFDLDEAVEDGYGELQDAEGIACIDDPEGRHGDPLRQRCARRRRRRSSCSPPRP